MGVGDAVRSVMRALHRARDAAFGGRRASGRHAVQWLHGMRRRNRWVRRGLLCPYRGGNRHGGNHCHDDHDRLHLMVLSCTDYRIPQLQALVLEVLILVVATASLRWAVKVGSVSYRLPASRITPARARHRESGTWSRR